MKLLLLDHIGVAAKSLEKALPFWTEIMDLQQSAPIENVDEQKVNVAFLPVGQSEVELLESTSEDGPIARYIDKNGEGIQHVAFRVECIEDAIAELMSKGVRMLDEKPRYGAGGARIAFVHPKSTGGILVELTERPKK